MSEPTPALTQLLTELNQPHRGVKRPPGYLVGLGATALVLLLMPLVYLGLIGGVGALCWWHLTNNFFLLALMAHGFYAALFAGFVYFGPVLAGGTMMVFMVRPLLKKAPVQPESRVLDPAEAPDFVALVHGVADAVGAPRPAEIRLDSQVNASASFRRGFRGWLTGELTLTVGLPLIEAMNTKEVAGILGHEFGHFAQGGGMRLSFVVRSLIYWFQRVVSHRDEWDQKLEASAKHSDVRIGIFFYLAKFFVGAARMVLGAVAKLSHLVCVFLLRAMEYDADRHEARIAGSAQFALTAHHLRRLGVAWQQANGEAARAWNDGALPRDFVAYVGHLEQHLDPAIDGQLHKGVDDEKPNVWATHPRDVDRIARAQKASEPGLVTVEVPCSSLFAGYRALTEAGSDVYYSARVGQPVDPAKYRPIAEVLATSEALRLDHEAYRGAVGPWAGLILPLDFHRHESDPDLPADEAAAWAAVEAHRKAIDEVNQAYDEAFGAQKSLEAYQAADRAGYGVASHLAKFEGKQPDLPAATLALQEALAPVHRRWARALKGYQDAEGWLEGHRRFVAQTQRLNGWQRDFAALGYLVQQDDNQKPARWNEIQRLLGRVRDALLGLEQAFEGLPYWFRERGETSLNEHLFGGAIEPLDRPNELYRQSGLALDRAAQVYTRLAGRLARCAF